MFRRRIFLNSVLLLLLVNFVSGFRLELIYKSLIKYQFKPHLSPWFSAACAAAIVHRNHFFCLYQKDKSSKSKVKFRQASNCCKKVFEAAKLAYGNKTRVHHISETRLSSVLCKGKSAIPPLFNHPEVLSSASDKTKRF